MREKSLTLKNIMEDLSRVTVSWLNFKLTIAFYELFLKSYLHDGFKGCIYLVTPPNENQPTPKHLIRKPTNYSVNR